MLSTEPNKKKKNQSKNRHDLKNTKQLAVSAQNFKLLECIVKNNATVKKFGL